MSSNPYRDDAADDDLFEPFEKAAEAARPDNAHRFDGKLCARCGIPHDLSKLGINVKELSLSERRKLEGLLEQMPDYVLSRALSADVDPPQVNLIESFIDYVSSVDTNNVMGPLMRSIVMVLDAQTDGHVTKMWRIYEVERRLLASHTALKNLNGLRAKVEDKTSDLDRRMRMAKVVNSMDVLMEFMVDRIAHDVEDYRASCARFDVEPVQSVIDSGTYPEEMNPIERLLATHGMGTTIFDLDTAN